MKRYFKHVALLLSIALVSGISAVAQDDKDKDKDKHKDKLSEYDEIIIKRKDDDKNGKVTIEIKGDEVLVNGKSIEEFDDENISVRKRSATRYRMAAPRSPFRNQGGTLYFDNDHSFHMNEDHAFLGVATEEAEGGAKILSVTDGSAAEKAGLKKEDVITKVNEKDIDKPEDLTNVISTYKPEDKITVTYKRNGKENKATAVLGKRSGFNMIAPRIQAIPDMKDFHFDFDGGDLGNVFAYGGRGRIGIRAQDTEDGKGVKVLDVNDDSPAEKAGIKEDDIITEFEGKSVNSADDLAKAARDAKDKSSLKVKLNRDGKSQTVEIKIPKRLKTSTL